MRSDSKLLQSNTRCLLLIFLCFFLTSSVYLSWVYRLMEQVPGQAADLISMVAGYAAQAAGIGLFFFAAKRIPSWISRSVFLIILVIFMVCAVPAVRSPFSAGVLIFGLLVNLFCGIIAGFYLYALYMHTTPGNRGLVFGGGYGIATLAAWLLSLPGGGGFLRSGSVLLFYLVLAICVGWNGWVVFVPDIQTGQETSFREQTSGAKPGSALPFSVLILAAVSVTLLSLVKNLGFNFPSADLAAGVNLEFSRIFYAVSLIVAGLISDKNRKYGAFCAAAALIVPFIMLALTGESVSSLVFWALDYLFYGFFSVYRILIFSDFADSSGIYAYSVLGLLFGRIGDAAGTGIASLFSAYRIALVSLTAALFVLTLLLLFRLYQHLYLTPAASISEQEVFEIFSARHDFSAREREVFRQLLAERTNAEIAETLFVSESTVKFHIHNLLKKTGCRSRIDLIQTYKSELYPVMTAAARRQA